MNTVIESLLKISPWITIVLPAAAVIVVCFFYIAFIKLVIPATLAFLFALLFYSVIR